MPYKDQEALFDRVIFESRQEMLFSRVAPATMLRYTSLRSLGIFHTPTTVPDADPVTKDELAGLSLQISVLLDKYKKQEIHPHAFFKSLTDKIEANKSNNAWTMLPPQDHVRMFSLLLSAAAVVLVFVVVLFFLLILSILFSYSWSGTCS